MATAPKLRVFRAVIAVFGALIVLFATSSAASAACPEAGIPARAGDPVAREAMKCLINRTRASHHRVRVRTNWKLQRAAQKYADKMVALDFFSHVDPSGGRLAGRVKASGYPSGATYWAAGENIGWGSSTLGKPGRMHSAFMDSPGHRTNLLRPIFRDVGIGVAPGTPVRTSNGATWSIVFGRRY